MPCQLSAFRYRVREPHRAFQIDGPRGATAGGEADGVFNAI